MPYKKTFRRKKRPYKKKRMVRRRRKYLPIGGFANRMFVKLRYVQSITLNAGPTTAASRNFHANSLNKPDVAAGSGAHQPSNYDRLTAIYDRYTVLGSKIKVYWVPQNNTALTPPVIAVHLSEAGTDLSTAYAAGGINNVIEQPRTARTISYVGQPSSSKVPLIVRTFSARKFFGVKNLIGEEPYSSDIAQDPAEGAFYEIMAMSPDGVIDPSSVLLRIEIEYVACMTEPKVADFSL